MKRKSYSSHKTDSGENVRRMPEQLSVRLNDDSNPNRGAEFDAALATGGATISNVIRELVDAYTRRVAERGEVPSFPLVVMPKAERDALRPK